MTIDELLQKQYIWIEQSINFSMIVSFSHSKEGKHYGIDLLASYDVEKKEWNYEFSENDIFEQVGFEEAKEKSIHYFENEMREYKEEWENVADMILQTLSFTQEYKIEEMIGSIHGAKRLTLKEAKIGKEKVRLGIYLNEQNQFNKVQITFFKHVIYGEIKKTRAFTFHLDFARNHFAGFSDFEQYLRTKSRDRLLFLF